MYNPLKLQQVLLLAKQERWDYKRLRREIEKILALDTSEIIFAKDVMIAEQLISFLDGTTGKVAWQDYLTTAKNAEIFTPNYKFYARQKNVVRDDFIAIFKHNIKRQQTEADLKRDISAVMQKYKNSAGTIANTALAQFTRYQNFEKMKDAGITLFKYVGPPLERDFCKQWYNRTVTLSELETLKNSFGNSAKVDCGGWNCRHHWQAVIKIGKVTIKEGAKPKIHEIDTANKLAKEGYNTDFIPESKTSGEKMYDAILTDPTESKYNAEFKSAKNVTSEHNHLTARIREANAKKADLLVIDVVQKDYNLEKAISESPLYASFFKPHTLKKIIFLKDEKIINVNV